MRAGEWKLGRIRGGDGGRRNVQASCGGDQLLVVFLIGVSDVLSAMKAVA